MATQAQKERQLRALARKWKSEGMSNEQVVEKLQPVADVKPTWPAKIVETDQKQVQPTSVDAIWVPEKTKITPKPQEQASQWEISAVAQPEGINVPQEQQNDQIEQANVQVETAKAPIMLNMEVSTPEQIARGVTTWQITMSDFQNLAQTNPEKYQLALIEKQKQEVMDQINRGEKNMFQAMQNVISSYEQQAATIGWGKEAVEEFRQFFGESEYTEVLKEKALAIAEIENWLRSLLDDVTEETGNADISYIMAKANKNEKLMQDERTLLLAEYNALQSQQALEYDKWLQEYSVFRQAEDKKMEFQADVLQKQYGLTVEAYNMWVAQAERELTALEQERTTIRETQAARAEAESAQMEFERDVMLEDMRRQRDVSLEDSRWERDKTYEMQLREMDFDDKVALMWLDVNIQAAILDNKLKMESEYWLNMKTTTTDDGTVIAYDTTGSNETKVLYSKDMVIPTGDILTHSGTWRKLDRAALPAFSQAYDELQAAGFGDMVFAEWHRDQVTTIQNMAARHWVAFDATNPDNTAAALRSMWHIVANVWMSEHEEWLAIDIYADWSYAAPTQEQVAILNRHGWKQTAGAGDMGHFEFVWWGSIASQKWYDPDLATLYTAYLEKGGLTWPMLEQVSALWLDLKDLWRQANEYKRQVGDKIWEDITKWLIDDLVKLRSMSEWWNRVQRMTSGTPVWPIFNSWQAAYDAQFNFVKNNLTLDKFLDLKANGATFGSMSEAEWAIIGSASTALNRTLELGDLQAEIDKHIAALQKAIPWWYNPVTNKSKEWSVPQSDAIERYKQEYSAESLIPK